MADLRQLAIARLRQSGLPEFPGLSVPEQLKNGRAAAYATLLKYVPELRFSVSNARDVMSQVNAWVERNQSELADAMKSPDTKLPRWLFLNMGSADRVQQWVIANFTVAAAGLGPWMSGKVSSLVADPNSDVSEAWANDDARSRLDAFAMIVKMDQDGDLDYIFNGTGGPTGMSGLPALAVWAIVVVVIGLAAVVATYFYLAKRLQLNNEMLDRWCREAQAEGDRATVDKCIEAVRDIQMATPWQGLTSEVGKVALILGGGYLAFRYGLPLLLDKIAGAMGGAKTGATRTP